MGASQGCPGVSHAGTTLVGQLKLGGQETLLEMPGAGVTW